MSDITIAASASAFEQLFNTLRDNFTFSKSDSANFGPFSASYSVALHLEGGTLTLNNDGTVEVQDVDVVWDTLKVEVCFDLPGWCVPSFCIVPDPWNGCLVGFPGFCLGGPICAPLDLSGLVSEISDVRASLMPSYYVDPARLGGWSDLDAELNGHPNKWRIFIDPEWVNIEPIDVPETVANLLENAVKDAIDNAIPSWVPGFVKDILWGLIGPILDLVTSILGIAGDIADWLSDLLMNAFGLLGAIETAVADYFANQYPIYEFEDPYPILPGESGLIPVKIPIRNLTATVDSKEMIVLADVGA
jgi:hypothetical protein